MISYGPTSSDLAVREPPAFSMKVWLNRPRPPVASQLTIHGEPFTSTSRKLPSNLGFVGLEAQPRNSPAARRANTIILVLRIASSFTQLAISDGGRLRFGGERRGEEHGACASKECPPVHHWITSSARCSSDVGIVSPSALAVFMLITRSILVGCSTGRSPG